MRLFIWVFLDKPTMPILLNLKTDFKFNIIDIIGAYIIVCEFC